MPTYKISCHVMSCSSRRCWARATSLSTTTTAYDHMPQEDQTRRERRTRERVSTSADSWQVQRETQQVRAAQQKAGLVISGFQKGEGKFRVREGGCGAGEGIVRRLPILSHRDCSILGEAFLAYVSHDMACRFAVQDAGLDICASDVETHEKHD